MQATSFANKNKQMNEKKPLILLQFVFKFCFLLFFKKKNSQIQ